MARLAMTTDYAGPATGDATQYLEGAASAGFSHVHWCHEWCTDVLYSYPEVDGIKGKLQSLGLKLLDLHATMGTENCYYASEDAAIRQAGVELVFNRIEMTAALGGDAIILHPPRKCESTQKGWWLAIWQAFDAIIPVAEKYNIRIALENMATTESWLIIQRIFDHYKSATLGFCYDSGHGNLIPDGLNRLEQVADKLCALHLHDNDGTGDQHLPPFRGSVDWTRLTQILAKISYAKPLTLETSKRNVSDLTEKEYLSECVNAGQKLAEMLAV